MLSFSEAGALIGKSHSTIARWVSEGLLAVIKDPSGLRRIRKSELETFYGATAMAKAAEEKAERQKRMAEERRQWQDEINDQIRNADPKARKFGNTEVGFARAAPKEPEPELEPDPELEPELVEDQPEE